MGRRRFQSAAGHPRPLVFRSRSKRALEWPIRGDVDFGPLLGPFRPLVFPSRSNRRPLWPIRGDVDSSPLLGIFNPRCSRIDQTASCGGRFGATSIRAPCWGSLTVGTSQPRETPPAVAVLGRRRFQPSVRAFRPLVSPKRSNRNLKWQLFGDVDCSPLLGILEPWRSRVDRSAT